MAVRDNTGGCWIGLNNLMQIILSDCKECEEVPMLGHAKSQVSCFKLSEQCEIHRLFILWQP